MINQFIYCALVTLASRGRQPGNAEFLREVIELAESSRMKLTGFIISGAEWGV